jgi:AcrR family transcriptional regulator
MRAKPVSQQRSQKTRDGILNAMDALLRHKSFEQISVGELAAKAQVAPATIYQRFSNVDATASVLLELYYQRIEDWAKETGKRGDSSKADSSLFDALLVLARNACEQISALGHIMRPAYIYSRQRPDRVGSEWFRLEKAALSGFGSFLRARSEELQIDDPKKAAALLCYFYNFMMLGPLLHGEEPHWKTPQSRKLFIHCIATMAYRYLTYPNQPQSG